ncbi:MAG: hypothetical protein SZ59_C0002G0269 [candidate division TM6 bacterium GW2011_GWF2_28_16]|nr:MAG: hypothetical protein SZ59_C0002G0269 [candidate division TM6 bacterium GW2011_GWF2_28_16]
MVKVKNKIKFFLILLNITSLYSQNSGLLLELENELHTKNVCILIKDDTIFCEVDKVDDKVLAKDLIAGQRIRSILGNLEIKNIYNVSLNDTLLSLINNEKMFFKVDYKINTHAFKKLYLEDFFTKQHLKSISIDFLIGFLFDLGFEASCRIINSKNYNTNNVTESALKAGARFAVVCEVISFVISSWADFLRDNEKQINGYNFVFQNLGFLLKDENDPAIINSGAKFLKVSFFDKTEKDNLTQKEILLDFDGNEIQDKFGKIACLQVLKV